MNAISEYVRAIVWVGMIVGSAAADDWPQWMGPERDNVWRESGVLREFPEGGPAVVWRAPVGIGFAGPAVSGGRVFLSDFVTQENVKVANFSRSEFTGIERILCFDEATGGELWRHEYPLTYTVSYPSGPRCTPCVDQDRVYTLGAEGSLFCFDVETGAVRWSRDLTSDYSAESPLWGYAAHPLIDGDKLLTLAGGEGSHIVALNKLTGEEIWRSVTASSQGYSPPTIVRAGGVRQLVLLTPSSVTSVDPETGSPYWSVPYEATSGSIIMSPVMSGNYLYAAGYKNKNLLLELARDRPAAEVVWRDLPRLISPVNVQPFVEGDVLYGFDQRGVLRAVRLPEGELLWQANDVVTERAAGNGTAFLVRNEDRHFLFTELGELVIAKLEAEGFEELDRARVIRPSNVSSGRDIVWSMPAFANRRAYIRNDNELICIDLSQESVDAARVDANAFDFIVGTWTSVKDGISMTTEVQPILGGAALQATTILDENNATIATAVFTFDARARRWTRTWFNNTGQRSTFVGKMNRDGTIALEQTAFDGRAIDPPQSRLFYSPGPGRDGFVLDWQSRGREGEWAPRPSPYIHERVDRPAAPNGEGRIAFVSKRTGDWEIFTMKPDGTDVRNMTSHPRADHFPRWIAGGTRLSFRSQRDRDDGAWDRWEVDIDGTDAAKIPMLDRLNNPEVGEFPEIHPSGSYIVNAVEREGEQDLYLFRYDGGGARALAPAPGLDYRARFSPDGARVLFISERDGNPEIYTIHADGTRLARLTRNDASERYARWSPDGSRIAFASDRDGNGLEIYVMDADGSNPRRLTNNEVEDGEVSWSPDGRRLAYRSDAFGNSEICVVDVETGEITNLTNHDAYDGEPAWSP